MANVRDCYYPCGFRSWKLGHRLAEAIANVYGAYKFMIKNPTFMKLILKDRNVNWVFRGCSSTAENKSEG